MREVKHNGGTLKVMEKGETLNPNGRPKKGIGLVNDELKAKGYNPATKQDIEVNYMSLLQLEEEQLKEMVNDKTKPMLIRILVKNMLGGKGFDIIEKMLDRGIGKAVQKVESENKTDINILQPESEKLKDDLALGD